MLRLACRVLIVPALLLLLGGAIWLHLRDATPADPPPAAHRAVHGDHARRPAEPPAMPGLMPAPSPSPAAAAGSTGGLAADLWRRLGADTRDTARGEMAIVRELSDAIRRQIEQLLPR